LPQIKFQFFRSKTAIIVLDPNGDFAEQVAKFKDNTIYFRKKDIIYIDPFRENSSTSVKFQIQKFKILIINLLKKKRLKFEIVY
jgi:hypothetical protein